MNWLELKAKFNKYKCKVALGIIALLFIKAISAWTTYYLEKKEEKIAMPIKEIETSDLFNESRNYIVKKWKDWKKEIVYKVNPKNEKDKSIFSMKTIEEAEEQKELKGTFLFKDAKTDVSNKTTDYISYLNKKDYKKANWMYIKFSNAWVENTKTNFEKILLIKDNLRVVKVEPLYNVYTSKAIIKVTANWKIEDKLLEKKESNWNLYYYKDWDKFKLLNPEYIYLPVPFLKNSKLIEWDISHKSHILEMQIQKIYLQFPNKLYFKIGSKVSENVLYNRIKLEIINKKTKEVLFSKKYDFYEFNKKAKWKKWVVAWKMGYKITYWLPVIFDNNTFGTIIDKMMDNNWNLKLRDYEVKLTPYNDLDILLNYPSYSFNLKE